MPSDIPNASLVSLQYPLWFLHSVMDLIIINVTFQVGGNLPNSPVIDGAIIASTSEQILVNGMPGSD